MDATTQKSIADDLATLVNPINIITDQPWSAAEMYEYTESVIAQRQGTGQEAISNRIADADSQGFRTMSAGEKGYLGGAYLHRAASAGLLRKQMSIINNDLIHLLELQNTLALYHSTLVQIDDEFALAETIKDELDNDIANPEFVAATEQHDSALLILSNITYTDWKLLAQRRQGAVIDDEKELLLAIANLIPTIDILEYIFEGNTAFKVNKSMTFANAKAELIEDIAPVIEDVEIEI